MKGWKKPGGEIKNLEIIRACHAICRRIKKELNLTHSAAHVGADGSELADRMAMLSARRKEKSYGRIGEKLISRHCSSSGRGDHLEASN